MKLKKFGVLFALFILPLVFYIFLSQGIYKYANLPILTEEVTDLSEFTSEATFNNHLTVVCFLGSDVNEAKASLFNLNQTIYKRYNSKPLFQMVAIMPKGTEEAYDQAIEEMRAFVSIDKWHFVYLDPNEIEEIFNSLKTPFQLNDQHYSENAMIVDMENRLRGRKDDEDSYDGKLYGYNMRSIAVLKNKMKDDIDIIYYQLKKSVEKEARRKREI